VHTCAIMLTGPEEEEEVRALISSVICMPKHNMVLIIKARITMFLGKFLFDKVDCEQLIRIFIF
jgi:hypothetical protein